MQWIGINYLVIKDTVGNYAATVGASSTGVKSMCVKLTLFNVDAS